MGRATAAKECGIVGEPARIPPLATTTKTGLEVRCELDENIYPTGRKVTKAEFATVNIERDPFHGEWNYTILPSGWKA